MTSRDKPLELVETVVETVKVTIRKLDRATQRHLRENAQARGMTIPEYIAALVDLHRAAREEADRTPHGITQQLLVLLRLETVKR